MRRGPSGARVEYREVAACGVLYVAGEAAMGASSLRRLLASMLSRTMFWRWSGICCHWPSLAAFRSRGCMAGISVAGLVPGILAFGERSVERYGRPPLSATSFNHCSHSSSMTVPCAPASRSAAATISRSFNCSPTLVISLSESSPSSSISFSSASASSWISSISSTPDRCACGALGSRSPGSIQSHISLLVLSWIIIPCSFSNRSFAQRVPSHFVRLAISDLVSPRFSKARKRRRCQG